MPERIKNYFRAVMYGRNGWDRLNMALVVLAVVVAALQFLFSMLFGRPGSMYGMSVVLIGLAVFRFLSRNAMRRQAENMMYMRFADSIKQRVSSSRASRVQSRNQNPYRAHDKPGGRPKAKPKRTKIVSCKTCGQRLRVPKGKGRIKVHCPKCGGAFEHRS